MRDNLTVSHRMSIAMHRAYLISAQTRQKLSAAIAFSVAYLASDYYHYKQGSTFFRSTVWRKYFEYREQKAQRQLE